MNLATCKLRRGGAKIAGETVPNIRPEESSGSKERRGDRTLAEMGQRYDPLTLRLTGQLLRLKAMVCRTKEERSAARQAVARVRFLKTAYKLLWSMKYDPVASSWSEGTIDLLKTVVRRIEDDVGVLMEQLMPSPRTDDATA